MLRYDGEVLDGTSLPVIQSPLPGPKSSSFLSQLRFFESRQITPPNSHDLIVWRKACGANVLDSDNNCYVDLSGAFGVASIGHNNSSVVKAVCQQAENLLHGMGDIYPPESKIAMLEEITHRLPGGLGSLIPCVSGSEAIEVAMKTAFLATGRPGIISFSGAYHGLTYGALSVTGIKKFREGFAPQLLPHVYHFPFPDAEPPQDDLDKAAAIELQYPDYVGQIETWVEEFSVPLKLIGAMIIEPVQGRAGCRVPPNGFLIGLRKFCDKHKIILIADEIMTGWYRTGPRFASLGENIIPDILCMGKAMGGGLPIGMVAGRSAVMDAWPPSTGEALHTSTFLGNPLVSAAAVCAIRELDRLSMHVQEIHRWWVGRIKHVTEKGLPFDIHGRGAMWGIRILKTSSTAPGFSAISLCERLLNRGYIVIPCGEANDTIQVVPPFTISTEQLDGFWDAFLLAFRDIKEGPVRTVDRSSRKS